jgi:hypothetical protein
VPKGANKAEAGFYGVCEISSARGPKDQRADAQLHTQNPEIPGSPALLAPGDLLPSRLEFVTVVQLYSRICV